jgi:tRNA-dihydrouridine synthase
MEKLARHCADLGYDGIDINMGCPDQSAIKSGGGAGMILNPENAESIIAAAKTSGLPVSVKTRLGYSRVDEWQDWLTHILQQDITNLTIHLRSKKEMSKVPAHFELIPDIKKLRDQIAPQTLLTINGDIRDRMHGMELVEQYSVDGIMIGRGIFTNPFAFGESNRTTQKSAPVGTREDTKSEVQPEKVLTKSVTFPESNGVLDGSDRKSDLVGLLNLQLDLYDQYHTQTGRPFETLKRFFKIYIRDFAGASELRDQLMHTKSTDEVRALLVKSQAEILQ